MIPPLIRRKGSEIVLLRQHRAPVNVHDVDIRLGVESNFLLSNCNTKVPRRIMYALAWFTAGFYVFQQLMGPGVHCF